MKCLIFGKTGQVGQELLKLLPNSIFLDRNMVDLINPQAASDLVKEYQVDAVLNVAAFTNVDLAESENIIADTVNAKAPAAMAAAAAFLGVPFIHVSTDYVFDGLGKKPWVTTDLANPQSNYGITKLCGEKAIVKSGAVYCILRTSWVFSSHGSNFVKTMLKNGTSSKSLSIVDDQVGGPTPASEIAKALVMIAERLKCEPYLSGIYHLSGQPNVSWAGFAEEIFSQSRMQVEIKKIKTENYPTPARRPKNSRLDCSSTRDVFGIQQPFWRDELSLVLKALSK